MELPSILLVQSDKLLALLCRPALSLISILSLVMDFLNALLCVEKQVLRVLLGLPVKLVKLLGKRVFVAVRRPNLRHHVFYRRAVLLNYLVHVFRPYFVVGPRGRLRLLVFRIALKLLRGSITATV